MVKVMPKILYSQHTRPWATTRRCTPHCSPSRSPSPEPGQSPAAALPKKNVPLHRPQARHVQATLCTLGPGPPLVSGHHTALHPGVHLPNLDDHLALHQQPCHRRMCLDRGGDPRCVMCRHHSANPAMDRHSSLDTTSSNRPPPRPSSHWEAHWRRLVRSRNPARL